MEALATQAEAEGQIELLKGRLFEEQAGNATLREVLASRDQAIAELTTQAALHTEQALRETASVKGRWADTQQQASPRIAAVSSAREVGRSRTVVVCARIEPVTAASCRATRFWASILLINTGRSRTLTGRLHRSCADAPGGLFFVFMYCF